MHKKKTNDTYENLIKLSILQIYNPIYI